MLQTQTELKPCEEVIYHYWYRTKKQITDHFLDKELAALKEASLEKKLDTVRTWTKELPALFLKHEFMLRDNAIQAFNENRFREGYRWTFRALTKAPFSDKDFVRDVLYHTKRFVSKKGNN